MLAGLTPGPGGVARVEPARLRTYDRVHGGRPAAGGRQEGTAAGSEPWSAGPAPDTAHPRRGEVGQLATKPGESPRTVLMVLYFFPPVGGISTSRNVRNVQHLPRYGWTPVVLTPRDAADGPKDAGMLDIVPPGSAIIRTRSLEAGHVRPWVVGVRAALGSRRQRWRGRARTRSQGDQRTHAMRPAISYGKSTGVLFRLRRIVFFPDDQIGWLPFALLAALRRYRADPFDVVYSTASPITAHLVAGILKRFTGVPWVAEFRDPWLRTAIATPLPWLHRRLKAKIERWIIRSADRVVFVAPSTARMYRQLYPAAPDFVTIPNGYDRSEIMASSRDPDGPRRFRVVYTGTLYRPRELLTFLEGLDALLARRPELTGQLEVVFYGTKNRACQEIAEGVHADARLSRVVQFRGFLPRPAALQAVADADAALVLLGGGPGMGVYIPGKVFDYLGQSRQILAMIPRGDTWDLLEELGWGVCAEPDPTDVGHAIERLLTLPPPAGPADPDRKYDRVVLAGRLADTLDAAVASAPRGHGKGGPPPPPDPTDAPASP